MEFSRRVPGSSYIPMYPYEIKDPIRAYIELNVSGYLKETLWYWVIQTECPELELPNIADRLRAKYWIKWRNDIINHRDKT